MITFLFVALLVVFIVSVSIGVVRVDFRDVITIIVSHLSGSIPDVSETADIIVWQIRMPRVIAAVLIGAALAVAGCAFQCMFRNPLVEPYILGVSSGAAFGAALSMVVGISIVSFQFTSVFFAFIATIMTFLIATNRGTTKSLNLILTGLVVGALFTAGLSYLKIISLPGQLQEITFWLMGGFYTAQWDNIWPLLMIPAFIFIVFLQSNNMNLLSLGDDTAETSGVNVRKTKLILVVSATIITALSVSTVGIIAWVGLLVPHVCRLIIGPDNRYLIPMAVVFGSLFMLLCDTAARTITQWEIPITIITSIVMAPILISIIKKNDIRYFGG